jgi:hypothetical protein
MLWNHCDGNIPLILLVLCDKLRLHPYVVFDRKP